MEAEFKQLDEKINILIQRVRDLAKERDALQTRISKLEQLQEAAARRITGILDRLEDPNEA
jgi:FtsZ-binding cell division protein ZapB